MALISGKYWTGDLDIKPEAWGPLEYVSDVFLDRMENINGISRTNIKVGMPLWECSGVPINYVLNNHIDSITGTYSWYNNSISIPIDTYVELITSEPMLGPSPEAATILFSFKQVPKRQSIANFFCGIRSLDYPYRLWGLNQSNSADYRYNVVYNRFTTSYTTFGKSFTDLCVSTVNATNHKTYIDNELFNDASTDITYNLDYNYKTIGYMGGIDKATIIDSILVLDCGIDQYTSENISDNKYALWQPIIRRTYFIPDGDIGITLVSNNLNTSSFLDSYQLNLIKLLSPVDVLVASNVTDSILAGLINIVQGNDVSADSLITTVSVQAIRKLIGQEISSITQITDVILSTAKQFNLTDLESLTEITNVVFSVIRKLSIDDVNISSEIVNISIDVVKFLLSNNVSSSSEITSNNLTQIKNIVPNNLISLSTITDAVISLTGNTTFNDPKSQTEITSIVMSVLRQLYINDLTSDAEITSVYLNSIKKINFNVVSSISQIDSIVVSTTEVMGIDNLSLTTSITKAILEVFKGLTPIDVNIESNVISPAISVLRNIFSNTINISSSINSVGMSVVGLTVTGKVSVTFSMAVPGGTFTLR